MPGVLLLIVLGFVIGALVRPTSRALAIVGVLAVLDVASLVVSVADGKGDDPWWLILMGLVGAAIALALVRVGAGLRRPAVA